MEESKAKEFELSELLKFREFAFCFLNFFRTALVEKSFLLYQKRTISGLIIVFYIYFYIQRSFFTLVE